MYSFYDPHTRKPLKKHLEYFHEFLEAFSKKTPKRKFFFGGGIRGGKTYLSLYMMCFACQIVRGLRCHIVRQDLGKLVSTVEPSLVKLLGSKKYRRHADPKDYYFEFENGSRIYFFSESFKSNKDLAKFKGMETNIIFLEQIEEIQKETYEMALTRIGSWVIPGYSEEKAPPPMILSTMNPTHVDWVRELIYYPWRDDTTPADTFIQMVTSIDNPYVTSEQRKNWESSDPITYKQFVLGDWDTTRIGSPYLYAFDRTKHIGSHEVGNTVWLSFDFNLNPAVAILATVDTDNDAVYVHKEFRHENVTIRDVCIEIAPFIRGKRVFVTGDITGNNGQLISTKTLYDVIIETLGLTHNSLRFLGKKNLGLALSRELCNLVMAKNIVQVDESCKFLINDIANVQVKKDNKIDKKNLNLTHLLDAFRYLLHINFFDKLKSKLILKNLTSDDDD